MIHVFTTSENITYITWIHNLHKKTTVSDWIKNSPKI